MIIEYRLMHTSDANDILAIYAPYILHNAATFEMKVPSLESFTHRIIKIAENSPFIVAVVEGKVVGYTYASEHRSREAYMWSKEVSVYLLDDFQRQGIATRLYDLLFDILKWMGIKIVLAGITLPNPKSISFHQKIGFGLIGIYPAIGYKIGQWQDVKWFTLRLDKSNNPPPLQLNNYLQWPGQF